MLPNTFMLPIYIIILLIYYNSSYNFSYIFFKEKYLTVTKGINYII